MNVILIYPEFPDTFWSFKYALKFVHKKASLPPLGLITVASMLPESWDCKLVDLNVTTLTADDLQWADMAFVSAMAVQQESARNVIALCNKTGLNVVAGGPLFTSEHEDFPTVDHFVLNEAELTLQPFLDDLLAGIPKKIYTSNLFPDLTKTPVPQWHLLDIKKYASMALQFSRGCPYQCDFCNVTALLGHKIRTKTSDQIIAELDGLHKMGWLDSIFFVDDNFIAHKSYLKKDLLPRLIAWQKNNRTTTKFYTECSINLADDPELLDLMVLAGFTQVFIGIETPDDTALQACGKQHNTSRDMLENVRKIQQAGIEVQGGFIVGFDSDTPSIFRKQIDFIQKSGIVTAMVGVLQALPGTKLYERMQKEGRLLHNSSGDNADSNTNFIPKMDIDILRKGYTDMMTQLYSPKHYYKRIRTLLREYQPPKFKSRFRLSQLLAFARSTVLLGMVGRERFQYWKMLGWTLFNRQESLPLAVTLAIYGHHFRKVCTLHLKETIRE
ncbi:B12-binding domain-containing radical SAM protein [Chlorobium phaeobacteroides]|uniref:Radical SAM domain protein n=1 Tax=Chlorobium phaeobacteroides (strain DSM 266 / SMG 266 / 2430) TaxID=290317 RepID=A1BIN8_CHLPD|nr:B12-binding domain-containing radical SAM protein [Chlorobium phaeobacteroides]ABL66265.1 Radical SAM domain protein [Chlorobium phaeobacteroides DSM 266]